MMRRVLLYLALAVVCPGAVLWAGRKRSAPRSR